MEDINEIVELNELYDLYKELLTDKQREYYEAFYFNNLSLSEIGTLSNVSRAAVHSQLKIVKDELYRYDKALNMSKYNKMIDELKTLNNKDVDKILSKYEEN